MLTQDQIDEWKEKAANDSGPSVYLTALPDYLYNQGVLMYGHKWMGKNGFIRQGVLPR